jgi:hypothetical protein
MRLPREQEARSGQGEGETRRWGDKEMGRQGERETRRKGDKEKGRQGEDAHGKFGGQEKNRNHYSYQSSILFHL